MQIMKQQLEMDMKQQTGSKSGKEYIKAVLLLCLFNLYSEYIMQNSGLDDAQAEIKIAGRNLNNLKYADDTTLMAESEEELKSLLMKLKEEREKVGLKLNLQKTKIMAPSGGCCGSQEEQLHSQGVVAAWAQEGLEELSHVEGQEGRQ